MPDSFRPDTCRASPLVGSRLNRDVPAADQSHSGCPHHAGTTDAAHRMKRVFGLQDGLAGATRNYVGKPPRDDSSARPRRCAVATASVREPTPSLVKMLVRWVDTVRGLMNRA